MHTIRCVSSSTDTVMLFMRWTRPNPQMRHIDRAADEAGRGPGRPNPQMRHRRGKTDTIDAEATARAAINGEAATQPKSTRRLHRSHENPNNGQTLERSKPAPSLPTRSSRSS